MSNLISLNEVNEIFRENIDGSKLWGILHKEINNLPTYSAKEDTAEWTKDDECSNCGYYVYIGDRDNFCPHCGAIMKEH